MQAGLAFTAWAALERAAAYAWLAPGVRAGFVTDRNVLLFALAATAAGRRDEAIHAFMRSARLYDDLSLHRELGPLWEDRAKERLAAGDARGALRDLDQALFWNPGDAEELGWRARALAKIRMR